MEEIVAAEQQMIKQKEIIGKERNRNKHKKKKKGL